MSWNAPNKLSSYIIFGLIAIGLLAQLVYEPGSILVPLLVFAIIFWLYKFPPGRSRRQGGRPSAGRKTTERKQTFRVIRGNKHNDEEPPRYH